MPDPSPIDPAWIASRLTPAQRAALMWLPESGTVRLALDDGEKIALETLAAVSIDENVTAALAEWARRGWRATPLGLRVRAALEQNGDRHG